MDVDAFASRNLERAHVRRFDIVADRVCKPKQRKAIGTSECTPDNNVGNHTGPINVHSAALSTVATTARYPKSEQVAPSRFMLPVVSRADMGVSDTY